jgi:hypothetical protein
MAEQTPTPAAQPTSKPTSPKRIGTGRIIFAVVALLLIGFGCFIQFTDVGQTIPPKVLLYIDALLAGGSPEKEATAAKVIEGFDLLVIREGSENDKKVTSISYNNHKHIDKKVFEVLPDLYRLGTVNLSDTDVADADLKSIGQLKQLTSLLLSGTAVTNDGLASLHDLGRLESFYLMNTSISDAGMVHITALPSVTILDLSGTKITDAALKELEKCPKLNWLLLTGTSITDECIPSLAKMSTLGRLTIFDTKITPAGVQKLMASRANSSTKLTVDSGSAPQIAPAPASNDQQPPAGETEESKPDDSL